MLWNKIILHVEPVSSQDLHPQIITSKQLKKPDELALFDILVTHQVSILLKTNLTRRVGNARYSRES